jgi:hypothetical protein
MKKSKSSARYRFGNKSQQPRITQTIFYSAAFTQGPYQRCSVAGLPQSHLCSRRSWKCNEQAGKMVQGHIIGRPSPFRGSEFVCSRRSSSSFGTYTNRGVCPLFVHSLQLVLLHQLVLCITGRSFPVTNSLSA